MDIFSSETRKNLSELTRTLTTVLQRLLRRFAEDSIKYIISYPIQYIGYWYWTIRRIALGPPQVLNGQPLNVRPDDLKFYESGREGVKPESREYSRYFWQEHTRFVKCEISVRKVCRQPDRLYKLALCYHKPDGSLLNRNHHDWLIYSFDTRKAISIGCGWDKPGYWTPGDYTVRLYLDGVAVIGSFFIIKPLPRPPPPPPPKPPAEVLHQPSVQFYASETGRFQTESRRYSIRFLQQTTRWVICELTVRNRLYSQQDRTYHVTAQCYTAEGKLLWEDRTDWVIKSQE
jgi:hypothetical protein